MKAYPTFRLKREYRELLRTDSELRHIIALHVGRNEQAVRRWVREDSIQLANWNVLMPLWDYLTELGERLTIQDLLTADSQAIRKSVNL